MLTDPNEILKHWGFTLEQMFDPLPWDWVAVDSTGYYYNYLDEPRILRIGHVSWAFSGKYQNLYHLTKVAPLDMTGIDWLACKWRRPVDESKWIGLLGTFFDRDDECKGHIAELSELLKNVGSPFVMKSGYAYPMFTPFSIAELEEYLRRAREAGIE